MISVTITDRSGRTLSGQTLDAFYVVDRHAQPFSVGINCALGARDMRPYLAELARIADCYVSCYPNAGLPNAFGEYDEQPDETGALLRDFAASGFVNIVGGCCGTTPGSHQGDCAAIEGVRRGRCRREAGRRRSGSDADPSTAIPDPDPGPGSRLRQFSGLEPLTIRPDSNFQMIGERTNVTGSAKFARLIKAGNYAEAVRVALDQVRGGANLIDVNMDEGMLDSEQAMTTFLNYIATEPEIARVPIMIDSSKWSVLEAGLKCVQGKAVVNSISLKEGEARLPAEGADGPALRRRRGRDGVRRDRPGRHDRAEGRDLPARLQAADRAGRLRSVTTSSSIPNILAIATGLEEHNDYAINFIEATRIIKATCPGVKISGGVSNLSFSFRGNDVVREAIHSAFLYHAIKAGMDMGIVNAGQLVVYEDIPEGPARARRRRHLQPAAGRDRAAGAVCRDGEGHGQEARSRSRRGARRRSKSGCRTRWCTASSTSSRRTSKRRGSSTDEPLRHHRRAADGRHEDRRRPVRRRQDVPAAGGEERARDEEGRRLPDAVHGGAKSGLTGGRRRTQGTDR